MFVTMTVFAVSVPAVDTDDAVIGPDDVSDPTVALPIVEMAAAVMGALTDMPVPAVIAPVTLISPDRSRVVTRRALAVSVPPTSSLPVLVMLPTDKAEPVSGPLDDRPADVTMPDVEIAEELIAPAKLAEPAVSRPVMAAVFAVNAPAALTLPPN